MTRLALTLLVFFGLAMLFHLVNWKTLFAFALVATVLAVVLYLTYPVWAIVWFLLGGLGLLDGETAAAFRFIGLFPTVGMVAAVAVFAVLEVRDALTAP